ncbi:restriction endonuclease subunit S [Rodentibacter rarus]|uniref:restriction endonuclease subunit S n=1 Tax=Rodentibacter rarus TaxID=1908260 RepID=UPI00098686D6|nr:restriction endonuclease subunit S [Rodentibacter rarus]OOF38673.1 restriction endonuclease subunit S [Rodentibacter rarus]
MSDLGQYLTFSNGKSSPERNDLGNYAVFGSNGIIGYCNNSNSGSETIVIGRVGSYCGSVHFSEKSCWVTDNAIIAQSKIKEESRFWFYYLTFLNLNNMRTGSGQPLLNQSILKSIKINVPENSSDRIKIGKSLYQFDKKIQLNTQINQTLEQIAQGIFKSWFVDFDPVRAKADALAQGKTQAEAELAAMQIISGKTPEELTSLSQTHPAQYAELAEIAKAFPSEFEEVEGFGKVPRGWEVKRIDDVIQKIPVPPPSFSPPSLSQGDIPILDQGRSGIIGYHNNEAGVKASIEEPVIVFANHTCYMRLISYDFSAIQNIFTFKGKELNIYWTYLATLGKQEFVEYKGHFPDFLIKEIIVPNPKLTESFGKIVKENFSKIFLNDLENSYLSEIRDLLLPRLLSGEI